MGKIRYHILIILAITVFISVMVFLIFYPVPKPPVEDINRARASIYTAASRNAAEYSPQLYNEAKSYYDSAMKFWLAENSRFTYSRNYEKVSAFAALSAEKALKALDDAQNTTSGLGSNITQKIMSAREVNTALERRFSKYPLPSPVRNDISRGQMLIYESEIDLHNGKFSDAEKKITESEKLLVNAYKYADAAMRNYFRSYPDWKKWVDTAIAESRITQDYSLIVDKFSRKLIVFLNGEVKFEFSAELGKNWAGDKRIQGDRATPEGRYRITKKFESDSTKYYKALLLNYPNEEDTADFTSAKEKGILSLSAKIGDMIEIHGNGGKGSDWTAGCIALTDREMDSLFKIVRIGTPVTIVGSINDLKYVLKKEASYGK